MSFPAALIKRFPMILFALGCAIATGARATLLGPLEYRSFADSPFAATDFSGGYFYLEDFEDRQLNTPGVTAVANGTGVTLGVWTGGFRDSVDGDDGSIDGSGSEGYSFSNLNNTASEGPGYTFLFDPGLPGGLPTHVGIVWTDGGKGISTQFEAFDATGASLGLIGPVKVGDYSWSGTTAEDRFFGVIHSGGIASFTIRDPGGHNNLEVDHLQYGRLNAVPSPATIWLFLPGLLAMSFMARLSAGAAGTRESASVPQTVG